MVEHLSNAVHWHAMHAGYCMPDEEKLPFLTWRPSGLTPCKNGDR